MRKAFGLFALALLCSAGAARAETTSSGARKPAQMEYLRGMLLEHRGDYGEALKAYESALGFDPDSSYIGREAASLALEVGQLDKALKWAARVVELDPKSAESRLLLGRVQWAKSDGEAAEASFEEALKLDPKSAESIYSLSSLLAAKEPAKAQKLLERFMEQNPAHAAEAHFQIAKLEMQGGQVRQAQEHLRESIKLNPEDESLPARYALAEAFEVEHDTDAALAEYLRIQKFEPQNVALLDHIGQIYFLKGNWEELRNQFEAAKAAKPDDDTANHWLALYAERQGDFAKAAGFLQSSSALGQEPSLSLRLSYYLTQAGRLKEAVAVLESAHARWPNNDQVAYFLALGYDDLKEDPQAIRLLRKVLELKPDYREARYQLAVLLEKSGRIGEAEKEFRLLLAQKADDASVLNYLGYSLADRGLKLEEAEAFVARAVELDPKNPAYVDSLGWVHFKLGKSSQALSELTQALRGLPEDETVWEHLGDLYAARGEMPTAWRYWRRSESLYAPESKVPHKAEDAQKKFSPEDLGKYYQDYLASAQSGFKKVSGLCEFKGQILGKTFAYNGLVTFKAPGELTLELLGPLFTPILRMKLGEGGFTMDPLRIEGLKPEAVDAAADQTMALLRDYFMGRFFAMKPASFKKAWRGGGDIELPEWRLGLDPSGARAQTITPLKEGVALTLDRFSRVQGRLAPKSLTASGKGFALAVEFTDVKMEFAPLVLPQAAP